MESIKAMLNDASNIRLNMKEKTVFDVSGYPHYENVISNLLAFFFDPTEEHRLIDLFLKSLFECYADMTGNRIQLGEFEEIEREYSTEDRKRIDILIKLSNAIVCIENKIYARDYNPFDEYIKEINKIKDNREVIAIILSLNKIEDKKSEDIIFFDITYKDFIDKVKKNKSSYIINANEKWVMILDELLTNIENLGARMDKEWQKFIKNHNETMLNFFEKYRIDIDSKIKLINRIYETLFDKLNNSSYANIKKGLYNTKNRASFRGHFSIYIDIEKDDETLVLEPSVFRDDLAYLSLAIWNRERQKTDWSKIKELFEPKYKDMKQTVYVDWGEYILLEKIDFEKEIQVEYFADKL